MSNIYETIKMEFGKKIFHVWQKGKSFLSALEKEKRFSDMWTIIMRLTRSKWF